MRRIDALRALLAASWAPAVLGASSSGDAAPPAVWFPTADGFLAYQRFGSGTPQLVFLMGGPGIDPAVAAPLIADLARTTEVIVFHQRGTGLSFDAPASNADLTVAGAVADLEALRVALGRPQLVLVGQSWGSMLAMAYAAAHRERVASLALLDPGGPNMHFMRDFGRRVMAKLTPEERAAYAHTHGSTAEQLRLELLGDVHDRANVETLLASLGPRSSNTRVFHALSGDVARHYDVTTSLRDFDRPVFILFGDDDPSLAAKDDLVALFPAAHVVTIPEAGHLGWLDQPVAYPTAVIAFVRSLT